MLLANKKVADFVNKINLHLLCIEFMMIQMKKNLFNLKQTIASFGYTFNPERKTKQRNQWIISSL